MRRFAAALTLVLVASGCSHQAEDTVTVVAHDFFAVSQEVLDQFTADTGIQVTILRGGDAGIVVNQAVLTAGNPVGDVLFGVDTTLLSRAVDAGVFEPFASTRLAQVPVEYRGDGAVTPIDVGDVCLNYDPAAFGPGLPVPATLADLTDPRYAGMLVVEDPSISSPGLAFLLSTIAEFGEDGPYTWQDYWADLRANGVVVAPDWGTAYYGRFSGSGRRPPHRRLLLDLSRRRGDVRRSADRRPDHGGHHRRVLPPGRVRRYAEGHRPSGGRPRLHRLHARPAVPGGRARPDVRVPDSARRRPPRRFGRPR